MAAPDFHPDTIQLLSHRSSFICNNPRCATITVGPSDASGPLATKLGEAAHICAKKPGQPRYDANMSDDQRASFENGIWLCASCHTLIDKNNGADFPADMVRKWKSDHEAMIKALLLSHRSPMPFLRGFTEEGKIAQALIDVFEQHGAMFQEMIYEKSSHVLTSVERLRTKVSGFTRQVKYDQVLKDHFKEISKALGTYMNVTSNFPHLDQGELMGLRNRIGVRLRILEEDYGCKVKGDLRRILP